MMQKDGPIKKFYLIKQYGDAMRAAGLDPKTMSCAQIEAWVEQQGKVS